MGSIESDRFFLFRSTILVLLILQYCSLTTTAQPRYLYHFCLEGNYSTITGKTYKNNLDNLLSSLSSLQLSLVISNGYFYNQVGENPDTVYGAGQCNSDSRSQICKDCVDTAAADIIGSDRCPNSKQAIIWYGECMLRYSNQSFISIMQQTPSVYLVNTANVTNPDLFNRIVGGLMDNLTKEAVSSTGSSKLFATGKTNFTEFQMIYGQVQCTFDLSLVNCNRCLRGALSELPTCCDGKLGGRVFQPSCSFRYEIYPFDLSSALPAPPPLVVPLPTLTSPTTTNSKGKKSSTIVIIIVVLTVITVLSTIIIGYFYLQRRKADRQFDDVDEIQNAESFQFSFNTIRVATGDFSNASKLGQGGFGSVYKGALLDGQDIAVKRLSRSSGQGEQEFKNEVELVVKLQHMNLVRLLGFSIHGEERLLIYEFMPNGSLDQFIFDPVKCKYLDWETRYKIIGGIARGLLYLHEDSRLMIIHRDLKASNVLLGEDMNPKIADFGMARMFMWIYVFSFGVLVLEILSGTKNNSFYGSESAQDLLSYAWQHWKDGTSLELLDPTLRERYSRIEVMRCIQIGLLCVQEDISDRPTMASIINMLNNNSVTLQSPTSPPSYL